MWRLVKYLEENQRLLFDTVDARKETHSELAKKLAEFRPSEAKDNAELANAVIAALWLGRRAQQIKEESGDKSAEQLFREVVMVAFETGRRSAITAP